MQSHLYGDFSREYKEEIHDPLKYIFRPLEEGDEREVLRSHKFRLAQMRAHYSEAEELVSSCEVDRKLSYRTAWEEESALRSFLATLQYIGLDLSVRAISQYAKELAMDEGEYKNLIKNIVYGTCSPNLSSISLKELENNLLVKFQKPNLFRLPTYEKTPLFNLEAMPMTVSKLEREREFLLTVKLFRAFCSYGGDVDDLRLMTSIVKNPLITQYVINHIIGKKYGWDDQYNKIYTEVTPNTVRVSCDGYLCRQATKDQFLNSVPSALGTRDYGVAYSKAYCKRFKNADYKLQNQNPLVLSWIKETSLEEERLLVSQFLALVYGVSDFFINSGNYKDVMTRMRTTLDLHYDDWTNKEIERYSKNLEYEDVLSVDLVPRERYFHVFEPKFKVVFDVNQGEFDKSIYENGKIKASFTIEIEKDFLAWVRKESGLKSNQTKEKQELIQNAVNQRVKEVVEKIKTKMVIIPWSGDISSLIGDEIQYQVLSYRGKFFQKSREQFVKIPVVFNYGPFALKYLREEYLAAPYDPLEKYRAIPASP